MESRVELIITGESATLELERAVPYGILLNELISNACKHAFTGQERGTLSVNVSKSDGYLQLTVADSGQGLPPGFDYKNATTLGLKLVHGLVRQLRGTIELSSDPGTRVNIRFPAALNQN